MTTDVTAGDSLRNAFGHALLDLAPLSDFQVFDCDVAGGTGLSAFRSEFPDRVTNLGIAEQNAVGWAAGYAMATGRKAVVSLFAAFAARAWEQFRLSVAYNRADVLLACSHLGLNVGPDGASAQATEAVALWTTVPGTIVLWPPTPALTRQAVACLLAEHRGPAVLLTGRSPVTFDLPEWHRFRFGEARPVFGTKVPDVVVCGTGPGVGVAVEAAKVLSGRDVPTVVLDCHTLAPFDEAGVRAWCAPARVVVTVEDGGPSGLHSLVCRSLAQAENRPPVVPVCVWGWGESGEADELYEKHGITAEAVVGAAERWL